MTPTHIKNEEYNEIFFSMPRWQRFKKRPFLFLLFAALRRAFSLLEKIRGSAVFVAATTFFGAKMTTPLPGGEVLWLFGYYGGYELSLAKFMVNHIKPGDIFIDGGADDGYFSLLAESCGAKAHAFEPTPSTFNALLKKHAQGKNIVLNNQALWKEKSTLSLADFSGDSFGRGGFNSVIPMSELKQERDVAARNWKEVNVEAVTLDGYCIEHAIQPNFIQLDTEGSEFEVLEGAAKVLAASHPVVCVEVWASTIRSGKYARMERFMKDLAYTPCVLSKSGEAVPGSAVDDCTSVFMPANRS